MWRRREASPCQDNPARMQRVCVCVGGGRFGSRRCQLPSSSQNTQNAGNISLYLEFLDRFPASVNVIKWGFKPGVVSEIPASCKVHSLVTALLIRRTHPCVKTFRADGRQRKHASVTSVTCYAAAEGDPATQPWAECSRTSTGLLATLQKCRDLNTTTDNSQSLAMLLKPVATPPAGGGGEATVKTTKQE